MAVFTYRRQTRLHDKDTLIRLMAGMACHLKKSCCSVALLAAGGGHHGVTQLL
jgi:hypothetical protein